MTSIKTNIPAATPYENFNIWRVFLKVNPSPKQLTYQMRELIENNPSGTSQADQLKLHTQGIVGATIPEQKMRKDKFPLHNLSYALDHTPVPSDRLFPKPAGSSHKQSKRTTAQT